MCIEQLFWGIALKVKYLNAETSYDITNPSPTKFCWSFIKCGIILGYYEIFIKKKIFSREIEYTSNSIFYSLIFYRKWDLVM